MKKITFLLFSITVVMNAMAYDATGHRIIADIAYHNLTTKAKLAVDRLLGKQGIVYAATWADEIKSDKKYDYSYQWHYQNLKDSMTNEQLENLYQHPVSEGEHLFYAIAQMKARITKDKKDTEALKFLVHFMGDLHQPMHLGRVEDLGGNKTPVKWFGKTINMHSLWDSYMIEAQNYTYTEYSAYLRNKFESAKAKYLKENPIASLEAVYQIRNKIIFYDYTDTNSYHYTYLFSNDLDALLFRGGIQLAKTLNELYK
jgi:hypothetical protein